jgi:hypothetical protein
MTNFNDRGGDTRREKELHERMLRSIDSPSHVVTELATVVVGVREDVERLLPVPQVRGPGKCGGGGEVSPLHQPR